MIARGRQFVMKQRVHLPLVLTHHEVLVNMLYECPVDSPYDARGNCVLGYMMGGDVEVDGPWRECSSTPGIFRFATRGLAKPITPYWDPTGSSVLLQKVVPRRAQAARASRIFLESY